MFSAFLQLLAFFVIVSSALWVDTLFTSVIGRAAGQKTAFQAVFILVCIVCHCCFTVCRQSILIFVQVTIPWLILVNIRRPLYHDLASFLRAGLVGYQGREASPYCRLSCLRACLTRCMDCHVYECCLLVDCPNFLVLRRNDYHHFYVVVRYVNSRHCMSNQFWEGLASAL